MSNICEKTLNNNLCTTSIMNEIKWELALKLINEFDAKKTLTKKINDHEGDYVYNDCCTRKRKLLNETMIIKVYFLTMCFR